MFIDPSTLWYVPAGHLTQEIMETDENPDWNVPAMQSEQPLMPVPDWYVPGTQSKQSALLDTPELDW
jgi:hypothetical protein